MPPDLLLGGSQKIPQCILALSYEKNPLTLFGMHFEFMTFQHALYLISMVWSSLNYVIYKALLLSNSPELD